MTPEDYCQQKAAASGSSFYYSFLLLPPKRRQVIVALYAFCREVDDAVDECDDSQRAADTLAGWRAEIGEIRRDGGLVLDRHVSLTPLRKLWIAGRTWIAA
jgi:phytoene synthase